MVVHRSGAPSGGPPPSGRPLSHGPSHPLATDLVDPAVPFFPDPNRCRRYPLAVAPGAPSRRASGLRSARAEVARRTPGSGPGGRGGAGRPGPRRRGGALRRNGRRCAARLGRARRPAHDVPAGERLGGAGRPGGGRRRAGDGGGRARPLRGAPVPALRPAAGVGVPGSPRTPGPRPRAAAAPAPRRAGGPRTARRYRVPHTCRAAVGSGKGRAAMPCAARCGRRAVRRGGEPAGRCRAGAPPRRGCRPACCAGWRGPGTPAPYAGPRLR